jgi:hypothetical protein
LITHRSREVARDGVNFASTGHRKLVDRPGDLLIAGRSATPKDRRHGECPRFVKTGTKRGRSDHSFRTDRSRVIMRAMTSAAGSLARTGYDVLLDFSIPPAFPPTAQKILRDTPLNYIVLRPPLDICAARARDRAEGKIAKYDRGFYAAFAAEERHAVAPDDSESPKAIADVIFKGLAEGHFRVGPDAIAPL